MRIRFIVFAGFAASNFEDRAMMGAPSGSVPPPFNADWVRGVEPLAPSVSAMEFLERDLS